MKRFLSLSPLALLALGLLIATPASAQDKPGTCNGTGQRLGQGRGNGQGNQGKVRPNFVDANGDGVCDHVADGTSRRRLRDGSCGNTPKADGTGRGNRARANSK